MSVIILTTSPTLLQSIQMRDTNATYIPNTYAIIAKRAAILCKETLDSLYLNHTHVHLNTCVKTVHHLADDFILRIVHDTSIMGPVSFLNVGYGDYTCPWGIWTLSKGDPERDDDFPLQFLSIEEAAKAYQLARAFTYTFSDHNKNRCKQLSYHL